jgi:amino acid transporter
MEQAPSYKKSLGLLELVSLGVGGTIGSGIFVVPGIAAKLVGPTALVAWLIVAISASTVLLSLAYISPKIGAAGSFYSLFTSLFGKKIADILIILYIISSIVGVSTIAAGIGQYSTYFGQPHVLIIEIIIIAIFCGINIIGIQVSGITENVLTLLKIAPIVIISVLLLPFIRAENFVQTIPVTTASLFATIIIVYWPFTGFEISAIPVEEIKDKSLIRRALILIMIIVVGIYLVLNVALIGSVGASALAASPAPVATAASLVITNSGPVVAFIGIVAMLSAINAYIVGTSRILQNVARINSIPVIQDLSSRGTPAFALFAGCGISAAILLGINHFDQLATISVITTLIPYFFFCTSAWILVPVIKSRIISATGAISTIIILVIYFTV